MDTVTMETDMWISDIWDLDTMALGCTGSVDITGLVDITAVVITDFLQTISLYTCCLFSCMLMHLICV